MFKSTVIFAIIGRNSTLETNMKHRMSAKRQLSIFLVTGVPGIGKTTLTRKVADEVRKKSHYLNIQGFYTCERRDSSTRERTGFDICALANEKVCNNFDVWTLFIILENCSFSKDCGRWM
jgi:Cdc6-like AAA superfamily ATPase